MSTPYKKFDIYIIDSDLDARMRLKQATTLVTSFGQVYQASKLRECLEKVQVITGQIDVIFISGRMDKDETTSFIQSAKALSTCQDAAFVMVKSSADKQSASVAESVLSGADGLLFEPFSVDQLNEITNIAARVRKERGNAREEAALKFLLSDVINQIDQLAYLKAMEYETGPTFAKLKEMCGVFKTLQGDSVDIYKRLVVDTFEEAPLPKLVFQRKKYGGVSSRVAKRLEKKTMTDLGIDATKE